MKRLGGAYMRIATDDRVPPPESGDRLTKEEFMRRWEAHPEIKHAEHIGGRVYMPHRETVEHGKIQADVCAWIGQYSAGTRGTRGTSRGTAFVLNDTLQPDMLLRVQPEYGGMTWDEDKYLAGTPELVAEICTSADSYDLHVKFEVYQGARVPEYVAILLFEREICWHVLMGGRYQLLPAGPDGLWRSRVFPGLWLDGKSLLMGDMQRVIARLQEGLVSPEHQRFVEELATRETGPILRVSVSR